MLTKLEAGKLYLTTLGVVVAIEKIETVGNDDPTLYVFYQRLDLPNETRSVEYSKALARWHTVDEDPKGWHNYVY